MEKLSPKRQLAAIMFTDIVGYTALMGKDTAKALELVRVSKEIQKPLVEKHNGKWLKEMGDGAMAQFSTALDAVNCSIEIQEIARGKLDAKLRIGIHLGDVTVEEDDVYGDGVNVASRLESIADPGGIYISDAIQKAIQGQTDVQAKYLGEVKLKNVAYGVRTYALQGVGLPVPDTKEGEELSGRFLAELQRRGVIRAGATYVVLLLLLILLVPYASSLVDFPQWTSTALLTVLIIGFPVAIYLAWNFERSPEGFARTTSQESWQNPYKAGQKKPLTSNFIIAGMALIIVVMYVYPRYLSSTVADNEAGTEVTIDHKSIAVLPFSNTKPDPVTDYLGFAIADQIIGNLVYLKNITVRPSGSIRKYEKQVTDPIIVGDDLKVNYILIGNYLKEENIIRLNIELIDVNTNEIVWRQPIEVDFHSAFELQDIVSQKVVEGLNVKFSQEELDIIKKDIPDNPLAYEYYLRSISYPLTIEGDQLAIEMLNKSIELDSNYAPAYNELGYRNNSLAVFGLRNPEQTNKRVENYYLKALSLNGELLRALGDLARFYTETGSIEKAVELTIKMLDINPNNADNHFSLGYIYRYAGMLNESIQEMEKAVAIDPNNPRFRSLGITYINVGEYEKAFDAFEIDKGSTYAIGWQGTVLFRQGNQEQAMQYFDRVIAKEPEGLWGLYATVIKALIQGNTKEGLYATQKLEQAKFEDAETWYYATVGFYALLGDRDGCIRTLRRAVDGGYFNYPFMLTDFYLDSMRDDPEFQEILAIAKKKHLAFKKRYF